MATSAIPSMYIDQFGLDLTHQSQQKKSRLFGTVSAMNHESVKGESFSYESINKAPDFSVNDKLYEQTKYKFNSYTRIWGTTTPFEWDTMVSNAEINRMGRDPKAKITQSASFARGRLIDKTIVMALGASTVKVGTKFASTKDTAFAGQTVGVNGSGTSPIGLTINKIRKAKLAFNTAELDQSDKLYFVVSSEEIDFLADGVDIRSRDYEQIMSIISNSGTKEGLTYMGFNWIVTEELPVSNLVRTCYAYSETALCYGKSSGLEVNTDRVATMKFNWAIRLEEDFGFVRVNDKAVVWVETATAASDKTIDIKDTSTLT